MNDCAICEAPLNEHNTAGRDTLGRGRSMNDMSHFWFNDFLPIAGAVVLYWMLVVAVGGVLL